MRYVIRFRKKGFAGGGPIACIEVASAANFRDAFYQAMPFPRGTSWYDMTCEDTGEVITLVQVRAGREF